MTRSLVLKKIILGSENMVTTSNYIPKCRDKTSILGPEIWSLKLKMLSLQVIVCQKEGTKHVF